MGKNIALIGFMGTGKSEIGRRLSDRLGKTFLEMDDLIVEKAGKSITEIFEEDGEEAFRRLEREVTGEVSAREDVVIACGGGVVLDEINVENLRKSTVLLLLSASPEIILNRVSKDGETRPLLNVQDKMERIRGLLEFRQPFYLRAADHVIDTSDLEPDQVVDEIMEFVKGEV
ncbi:MAG: shikimate kinase [Candidatus Bathyarchaeia archaeon]